MFYMANNLGDCMKEEDGERWSYSKYDIIPLATPYMSKIIDA